MAEVKEAPDPEATLRLHTRNVVEIAARYADVDDVLRQAAGADPELRELWDDSEQRRRDGAAIILDNLLTKGPLKPGLDRQQAVDICVC